MLLALEGFDNDRMPITWTRDGGGFVAGRTGGRAVAANGGFNRTRVTAPVPNLGGLAVGFGLNRGGAGDVNIYGQAGPVANASWAVQLKGTAGGAAATNHLALVYTAADDWLKLYGPADTVIGSWQQAGLEAAWQHVGIEAVIADSGGRCKVQLNGQTVIDVTGADTLRTGQPGTVAEVTIAGGGSNVNLLVDDYYLADLTGAAPYNALLGDCKIETLRPAANGASSGWVGSDANSVDNYLLVDDNADTTDYVAASAVGQRDLYELTNVTGTNLGEILAVQVEAFQAKSDAGVIPGNLHAALRSVGGTVTSHVLATPAQVSTAYQWSAGAILTADPAGDPWTVARVDGLQAGVEVVAP